MSIPRYSLYARRFLPTQLPPIVARSAVLDGHVASYVGDKAMAGRIRYCLRAYALRQPSFWASSMYLLVLGILTLFADHRSLSVPLTTSLVAIFLIAMAVAPVTVWVRLSGMASHYAQNGVKYSFAGDQDGIYWQVRSTVFRIEYVRVERVFERRGVFILKLRDTRALCIAPREVLDDDILGSLTRLSH